MIYLYWYLGVGVVGFAVFFGVHLLTKEKEPESIFDRLAASDPDRKKLHYRLIEYVVTPLLAITLVAVCWPVGIYWKVKEIFLKKNGSGIEAERKFVVEHQHLQERLTVQEVEQREVVTDPLKAVPELPFGHLNSAWQKFLSGHTADSELWSFSAQWQTAWGRKELRSGYAVVQDGAPGAYFLTVWKDILDEADSAITQAHDADLRE